MSLAFSIPLPRWLIIAQTGLVLASIEAALWSHGRTQSMWFMVAFAILLLSVLAPRQKVKELGIGSEGLVGATIAVPIALGAAAIILLVAWKLGTLRGLYGVYPAPWHAVFYAIWAFEQQFILNSFFYRRFEALMGDNTGTALVTALIFSLVHMPNPVLVPATFIGGLFFVEVFRRWRNIYPLAIAHAMLGLALAMAFPGPWIRHMRVGLGYLTFRG